MSAQPTAAAKSLDVKIVPAGSFARHDAANKCGNFATPTSVGGDNCYLVVRFTNIGPSTVDFIPADLRMVDYEGVAYYPGPVLPQRWDNVDMSAPANLEPRSSLTVQLCHPVMVGALPQKLQGARSLSGLSSTVPASVVDGTWGGM
jgi:hypothetical protein